MNHYKILNPKVFGRKFNITDVFPNKVDGFIKFTMCDGNCIILAKCKLESIDFKFVIINGNNEKPAICFCDNDGKYQVEDIHVINVVKQHLGQAEYYEEVQTINQLYELKSCLNLIKKVFICSLGANVYLKQIESQLLKKIKENIIIAKEQKENHVPIAFCLHSLCDFQGNLLFSNISDFNNCNIPTNVIAEINLQYEKLYG